MSGSASATLFPGPQILAAASQLGLNIQALTEAVRTACADPADAIRALSALATFSPTVPQGSGVLAEDNAAVITATAAVCRRAALASLAIASSTYAPTSYQDAITLRNTVCSALDAEILVAADAGDNNSYVALKALRAAVSTDLTTRAASLASEITVTLPGSLPALVVAYRLYQDASRCTDLVARVNPVSPLFMPTSFQALAY